MRTTRYSSLIAGAAVLLALTCTIAGAAVCPQAVLFTPDDTGSTADTGFTGLLLGTSLLSLAIVAKLLKNSKR